MKQTISLEQFMDLPQPARVKEKAYRDGWYERTYPNVAVKRWPPEMFWNIGQMIEFLKDHDFRQEKFEIRAGWEDGEKAWVLDEDSHYYTDDELIDCLWQSVREVLEE